MQIQQLLQYATGQLSKLPTPRLDSELLLAEVLGCDRCHFYAHADEIVSSEPQRFFQALLNARRQGRPLAYLLGRREFWSLQLSVNAHTLIPRPETEHLVELALRLLPLSGHSMPRVLDLGTGSGAIAIALACEHLDCAITATDLCPHALRVALANARRHAPGRIRFFEGSWFNALPNDPAAANYALIISNPPYLSTDDPALSAPPLCFEPRQSLAVGQDGLQALHHILRTAPEYLGPGGYLLLEHGANQAQAVRTLLSEHGYADIGTIPDLQGLERVSYALRP